MESCGMGGEAVSEELERLQKEVARLHAELDDLKIKVYICYELLAGLREEVERLKRKTRRLSIKEHVETLRVEADEPEPP